MTLVVENVVACRCGEFPPYFCQNVDENTNIVFGEILGIENSDILTVLVLENLKNSVSTDTIRILGQDGVNCGETFHNLFVSDRVIFGIKKIEYYGDSLYYLHGCGLHYLKTSGATVLGPISPGVSAQSYEQFKIDLESCVQYVSTEESLIIRDQIRMYPNPTSDYIIIKSSELMNGNVEVFELSGNLIRMDRLESVEEYIFDLGDLQDGIYMVKIQNANFCIFEKIVIRSQ